MIGWVELRDDGRTMVLKGGGQRTWLTVPFATTFLVGAAGVIEANGGGAAFGAVVALVSGAYLVALYRVRVTVGVDHLEVRTVFRLRRLPWEDVAKADAVSAGTLPIFNELIVTLRSGYALRVDGVGRLVAFRGGRRTPVDDAAELINRRAGA